jgi:hypothetical protein
VLISVETKLFTSLVDQYLSGNEYAALLLTLYAKNEADSIPGHVLKKIKEEIDGGA